MKNIEEMEKIELNTLDSYLFSEDKLFAKNKVTGREILINIELDEDPENPREWGPLTKIITVKGNWDVGDESCSHDDFGKTVEDLMNNKNILVRLLYMYEHSGMTISLTPFNDPWDSGICGVIFIDKKTIEENDGETEDWKKVAQQIIEADVRLFDEYLTGDVHVLQLLDPNTEDIIDSLSGFYGQVKTSDLQEFIAENTEAEEERDIKNWDIYTTN